MCVPITLRLMGVTLRNFTRREAGVIMWVQLWEGLPQQNLGLQQRPKFDAISDNFPLLAQIKIDRHNKNLKIK